MKNLLKIFLGFILGLSIALLMTLIAGENPIHILGILLKSSFGSVYDLGLSLSYAAPMIFCGLSVAVAFHAGLFNIGAEGQLTMATIAAAWFGVSFPNIPFPFAPIIMALVAITVGALWGAIAGWLRAYRGSHEVIVTIMLNFVAAGLASWVTLNLIPNPQSQNPETAVVSSNYLTKNYDLTARFFTDTPANFSIILAVLVAIALWIFLWKTSLGFEIRAVGYNPEAARRAGISTKKSRILAMILAGSFAGMVAISEVIGSAGQYRIGFSPDYGFIGIAVALLAQNNPIGIILSAFLLGALHKGASDLDLETATITRDFSKIIQAMIILGVSAQGYWMWIQSRRNKSKGDQ